MNLPVLSTFTDDIRLSNQSVKRAVEIKPVIPMNITSFEQKIQSTKPTRMYVLMHVFAFFSQVLRKMLTACPRVLNFSANATCTLIRKEKIHLSFF